MSGEPGLIHLYWGDGKGKTTAAMGLALRALGSGRRVAVVQFLGAQIFRGKPGMKFSFQMNEAERAQTRALQTEHLRQALECGAGLLVLDEACAAWQKDLVDRDLLQRAVLDKPDAQELVLTGRQPPEWMREAADYITEMRCHRHPFERGVPAREGVEF